MPTQKLPSTLPTVAHQHTLVALPAHSSKPRQERTPRWVAQCRQHQRALQHSLFCAMLPFQQCSAKAVATRLPHSNRMLVESQSKQQGGESVQTARRRVRPKVHGKDARLRRATVLCTSRVRTGEAGHAPPACPAFDDYTAASAPAVLSTPHAAESERQRTAPTAASPCTAQPRVQPPASEHTIAGVLVCATSAVQLRTECRGFACNASAAVH